MGNVNIFESIGRVTTRIEPFHSQFLGDALSDSLNGNRDLFDRFWRLAAPTKWSVPACAGVSTEKDLGPKYGKIDICIYDFSIRPRRVLGIEVKTTDSSATEGQLNRYFDGLKHQLCESNPDVAVSYLTPFNEKRAGGFAKHLATITEFRDYAEKHPEARHVSWLDVAEIAWDYGNELWQQHRAYVFSRISSLEKLTERIKRDRSFNEFFGDGAADAFWEAMKALGIESEPEQGAHVNLGELEDIHAFVSAFEVLINRGQGIAEPKQPKTSAFSNRQSFLESRFGNLHKAIFGLSDKYNNVWLQGKKNYGLRVAHTSHGSGVSLVRSLNSDDCDQLLIGKPR